MASKRILISGGTSGIGKATVVLMLESGHKVVTFSSNQKKCAELKTELQSFGDNILVLDGDVTNFEDLKKIVAQAIKHFGGIDVLLNNAGIYRNFEADDIDPKEMSDLMRINVEGLIMLTSLVLPEMKKQQSGHVINIVSTAGIRPTPSQVYAASKHAVKGFTDSLRDEVKGDRIKVSSVYPGYVNTELFTEEEWQRRLQGAWKGQAPQMLRPEDIASAIAYVISQPEHVSVDDIVVTPF